MDIAAPKMEAVQVAAKEQNASFVENGSVTSDEMRPSPEIKTA